jgi:very-short-patch-repair endonuclease/predicted transcriptional regulator of viral defense system
VRRDHAETLEYEREAHEAARGARIAAFARSRHHVMTAAELRAQGLSEASVARWAREGRLFRRHRGVYAVGRQALTETGRAYAAVRACGRGALASNRAAAFLLELLHGLPARVDVTVSRTGARSRPGIRVHTSRTLAARDVAIADGVRCTSVARTLVDLGDHEPSRRVEQAFERAQILRVFDLAAIQDVLARVGPCRGARIARALLRLHAPPGLTDTEIEELFLALVRDAGLSSPETQRWIVLDDGGPPVRADFMWPRHGLVVETDGGAAHGTRKAFEDDRRRDQRLAAAGYTAIRFTWRQLVDEPARVVAVVGSLLARLARP